MLCCDIEVKECYIDLSFEVILECCKCVLSGDFEFFVYIYFLYYMWLDDG